MQLRFEAVIRTGQHAAEFKCSAFLDVLERMRTLGQRTGASLAEVMLDDAEWRWRAEAAMDACEVHDLEDVDDVVGVFDELSATDGEGPGWRALAASAAARSTRPSWSRPSSRAAR